MDPNHDIYSGVYLGDDIGTGQAEVVPSSFDYTVHKYGDEKKKGKKNKQSSSDETRYLQHLASMTDEQAQEPNIKMRYFDVDSRGTMYEKEENLLLGIERMQPNIFCPSAAACGDMRGGDDCSISFSEHKPPDYLSSYGISQTFEEFVPYFSGKNRNATPPEKQTNPKSLPTKDIFDEHGIFLGE